MSCFAEGGKAGVKKPANVYVISIGINKSVWPLNGCVNDAVYLVEKLKIDNARKDSLNSFNNSTKNGSSRLRAIIRHNIKEIIPYVLTDEEASLENIRKTFKEVISKASYNDYFVFLYSGISMESEEDNTYLVPYMSTYDIEFHAKGYSNRMTKFNKETLFSLSEMARLMEQISCNNQLIISEAGSGNDFGKNLISELFESNPLIAKGTERNRVILTTKEIGREDPAQKIGFLMKYILRSGNVLDVFHNFNKYEFRLSKAEMESPVSYSKYVAAYQEQEYRDILLKNYQRYGTRGAKSKKVGVESKTTDNVSETHAFILATDTYNKEQDSWGDLKNPIKDADVVAEILSERYNVKTTKVYNKGKNEVLKAFYKLVQQLGENDKLLFFVAGHGYYDQLSGGYLVMKDSESLEEDISLNTYLYMGKLKGILDGVKCKQVFSIFDVCYGASFELNYGDLEVENYSKTKFDKGFDAFMEEKDKNIARIVLASGQYEVFDYWKDSEDHSPFASKLIKALKTEKQFISPGKIFSYVQGNATTPILKKHGKHEARGDFLLKVK